MPGKRERDVSEGPTEFLQRRSPVTERSSPRLTHHNLTHHNASYQSDNISMPRRAFSASPTKTSASSFASATSGIIPAENLLDILGIYRNRGKDRPPKLQALIETITRPRLSEITPKSKFVVKANPTTKRMLQKTAINHIGDKLIYRGRLFEEDVDGERLIAKSLHDQWQDTLPVPLAQDVVRVMALNAVVEARGSLPSLNPDISFGYSDDAFTRDEHNCLTALQFTQGNRIFVTERPPWFPYLVVEWMTDVSESITFTKVEQQARRDGAAAVHTMYNLLYAADPATPPPEHLTCVFSLCVSSELAEYHVHWRRVDPITQKISWEADRIQSTFLFDESGVFALRGSVMNALDWVRGERLEAVREAITKTVMQPSITLQPTSPPATTPSLPRPSSPANKSPQTPKKQAAKRQRVDEQP